MKTCLVVDDSKVIRKVARHILETLNFEVSEAGDGREALDACLEAAPDVILLDWNMPVMSGMDFLRALKDSAVSGKPKVVTVIDTHAVLGLDDDGAAEGRAVITVIDGHHYAILVDALEDVTPCALQPLSGGILLDAGWRALGSGIVELDGEPVLAIDLRAMVPGLAAAA